MVSQALTSPPRSFGEGETVVGLSVENDIRKIVVAWGLNLKNS